MEIILGSGSPRRGEILRFFSIPFLQIASSFDEDSVAFTGDPADYVRTLSRKKAETLAPDHVDRALLTADTTVFCEGVIYNKPKSHEEAVLFLKTLSGKWHSVFTSLSLFHKGQMETKCEETRILFHELTLDQIHHYLQHVNFLDKAGSYAIQQSGSLVVKKIDGCYYNVMGLPLNSLKELLFAIGVDLWKHMKIL
jgi:septum formation protein